MPLRIVALILLASVTAALASPAPKNKPPIYNESADAKADVAAAVTKAKQENKRVLLGIGANWCGWCYKLHDAFADNAIWPILMNDYEVVMIDMGDTGKNQALLDSYGIKTQGYPYLAILDPDNKLVTQQDTGALEDGPKHDIAKLAAFLNKWKTTPLDAKKVLDEAFASAKSQDKPVFLRFGFPECGWCRRLDELVHRPEIQSALETEFIVVKIDIHRMTGGEALAKTYTSVGGYPWYAIVSPDGKVVSTSDLTPGKNIGFPTEPEEVEHVVKMLTDGHKRMSDEQAKTLREVFTQRAAEEKAHLATRK